MMMLSLDNLAHRYGMLPSEALARASTLDLHILDIGAKWVRYQQEQSESKSNGQLGKSKHSQAQLRAMMERARQVVEADRSKHE